MSALFISLLTYLSAGFGIPVIKVLSLFFVTSRYNKLLSLSLNDLMYSFLFGKKVSSISALFSVGSTRFKYASLACESCLVDKCSIKFSLFSTLSKVFKKKSAYRVLEVSALQLFLKH